MHSKRTTRKNCVMTSEIRVVKHAGGYWANHSAIAPQAMRAYLDAFEVVQIIARCEESDEVIGLHRVDDPRTRIVELQNYGGLWGSLTNLPRSALKILSTIDASTVCIGRIPEPLAVVLHLCAQIRRAPYISIVVSDVEQLIKSLFSRALASILAPIGASATRSIVRRSSGVVYVTRSWLQSRYPSRTTTPVLARSNVLLTESAFVSEPRTDSAAPKHLVSIAFLTSHVKGVDISIRTLAQLRDMGFHMSLTIIGGGNMPDSVKELISELRLDDAVVLKGHIANSKQLREELDRADIYLSTSRVEGLPRGMLEAMARGLPVVSTNAGGVSELVLPELLVEINDYHAAADRIRNLIRNSELINRASSHALLVAREVAEGTAPEVLAKFLVAVTRNNSGVRREESERVSPASS